MWKQSIAYWCLADTDWNWDASKICSAAQSLGVESVELAPPAVYPMLREHGLKCALCFNGMPGAPFVKGLNNRQFHAEIIARTKESIDLAAEYSFPNVIAFTGYKWRNPEDSSTPEISRQECLENCVAGLQELAPYAGKHGVKLCLEHLNTRDNTHPMKGHPGYQGDDIDFCAEIIRQVESPHVRLLFDFYHVQIMHGDLIRRFRKVYDVTGHVHTAGCPGRNEFNDAQEIHYPAIVSALKSTGYEGYVGHEFIPLGEPIAAFQNAVKLFQT